MALLVNGAGGSAADPILHGLRAQFVFGTSSFDVATVTNAWMDQAPGFPGTSSISASLTPTAATIIVGVTACYARDDRCCCRGETSTYRTRSGKAATII